MEIDKTILEKAKTIWDYHHLNMTIEPSELIFVLGSHDTRVAERSAELFLNNYAPLILFSGGLGNLTKNIWSKSEAEIFSKIAIKMGVPKEKILIEDKSTNTGENILFSFNLLEEKNIHPKSIILVQKPYMERRTYATFKKQWSQEDTKIFVTSPKIDFLNYPNKEISMNEVINIMVGDLQRIIEYPKKDYQIYQKVPDRVFGAYEFLKNKGFTEHLI